MSEPAADGEEVLVPQPSSATETVEEEETKQVVDGEAVAEKSRPEEVEVEVQQQDVEEKVESPPEDLKLEMQPEIEEGESESPEEQQPSQEEREEPEKAMDNSQDTVQMPISDTPERALEDEEMPSMVTISSTSRIDESETYNKQDETESDNKQDEDPKFAEVEKYSPQPVVAQEKDSDSDSVCVIDDDDDDDEEEQNDYDEEEEIRGNDRRRVRYNDDDDEGETSYDDEYDGSSSYDSEDDEERYNDKHDRRYQRNNRRDVDEDVEDDDEDDEDAENEDEYMDDRDFGGGGSDDAILRPNNTNGLSKQQKERSSSLQDLSLIQGPSPKSRQNVNPFSQKAIFERNQGKGKYAHVSSKVKKYIDDGAEQRRISIERRKKSIDEMRQKSEEPTEIQIQRSGELAMACQTIKNYAEKTLKEVAECEENEKILFLQQGVENGEISLIPRQLPRQMSSHTVEPVNKANEMEIDLIDEDDEKRPTTFNGTVPKENQNNFVTERKGIMRREDGPPKSSIFNGEDPLSFQQPIDNLRTLSYDEYMKGPANEVVVNRVDVSEVQSIAMREAEIEDDSGLRIESVVSNYSSEKVIEDFQNRKTPPTMVHQSTETFYQENPELHSLRAQLNQRNQQFENLREAYQKNMSDSMAMRIELENLRKAVAYYQEQLRSSPRIETKVSSVQTEVPAGSRDMPLIDLEGNDAKLGVSQVSTQWSDGTGSVTTISMDPPNVTNALNSDESAQPKTPLPKRNALSRAFMTSTKILQTLSSITHGKTKVDRFAKPPKTQEAEKPSKPGPASSKKRKASDAMDDSTQPTKIAKSNDQEGIEPTTPTSQFVNPNAVEQESAEKNDERPVEEPTSDDDVKVYVYPEDEGGHEHSFLIQAKEVSDNPKPGVRECGPYLLGNVEVYMTEVNGTINIWGKELSQTSQSTAEATDLDASARSRDLHQNLRWQSTPRIFNKHEQQVSASTGKKSRLLPRYLQPSSSRPEQLHQCEHSHRLSWPSCHEHQHQHHQHQHACCGNAPPVVPVASCGCVHEQKRAAAVTSCCMTKSMPNMNQNCCCSGHVKPLARRHSFNPTDEEDSDEEDDANRTLLADDYSPRSFSKSKASHQHAASEPRRSTGGSSNDPSMCENESDPLIAARQALDGMEGPEKRRKKKVRGILMDLLRKGCAGDCRPNPLDKSNLHHTTSIYEPSTSAQHKAPCLPSQPSHSHRSNERCSSCCSKQPDKTSQIEAQMERFREEMDKLRSQSDTLAGMIQALKNADVID